MLSALEPLGTTPASISLPSCPSPGTWLLQSTAAGCSFLKISQCGLHHAHRNTMCGSGPKEHLQDKEERTTIKVAGSSLCYRRCNYPTAGPGLSPVNRQEIRQKQTGIYFNHNLMRFLHPGPLSSHFVLQPFILVLFRPPLCLHADAEDNFLCDLFFFLAIIFMRKQLQYSPL